MAEFLGLGEDELRLFLEETREHLDTLETELLEVERGGVDSERVARVFRAAHTIKGAAATVGLEGMAGLTHAMETLFDRMRSGDLVPTSTVMTALLSAVDLLRRMLAAVGARILPEDPPAELTRALELAGSGEGALQDVESGSCIDDHPEGLAGSILVRVRLNPDCLMPAVRALQVLLALEQLGDVRGSDPDRGRIEAEQISASLTVWMDTDREMDAIRTVLAGISDIVELQVDTLGDPAGGRPTAGGAPSTGVALGRVLSVTASAQGSAGAYAREDTAPAHRNGSQSQVALGGEDRTIRVHVGVLDDLMNLVGELVIDRGRLSGIGQLLAERAGAQDVAEELGLLTAHLARVTGTLQETVLKARMLPIERMFKKFPRMVRDLAHQMGKKVDFQVAGEETELDRSLLEVIGDPLMHLLRNAFDHGLESAEERQRVGKPVTGTLRLVAAHEENHVVILLQDDGRGIDPERVRASAVRKGLLSAERARELGDEDAIALLFVSGFSTTEQVTDISGRGVGLDVVRKNIERVGGRIEVESQVGVGTTFRLLLPLTLATIRALLVDVANETLALPLSSVAETLRVSPDEVFSIKGRWVTRVRGRVVPLFWLEQFMSLGFQPVRSEGPALAVLVSHKGDLIGLVVNRLLGEQEVVVKGLGEFFGQVKGISGVTILGDGSLALIVDIGGLIGILGGDQAVLQGLGGHMTVAV